MSINPMHAKPSKHFRLALIPLPDSSAFLTVLTWPVLIEFHRSSFGGFTSTVGSVIFFVIGAD